MLGISGFVAKDIVNKCFGMCLASLPPKLKFLLLKRMARDYGIQTMVTHCNGCVFEGDPNDEVCLRIVLEKHSWDSELIELLTRFFRKHGSGTFIDVGANIGLITIPVAKLPFVRCKCYEPVPVNFELLKRNIAANQVLQNVDPEIMAVADRDGQILMELSPDSSGDHRVRQDGPVRDGLFNEAARAELRVEAARLDTILDSSTLKESVVIKIDVQGSEPLVIEGARKTIGVAAFLVIEYWPYGINRLGVSIDAFHRDIASLFRYGVLLTKERYREYLERDTLVLEPIEMVLKRLATMGTEDAYFDVLLSRTESI